MPHLHRPDDERMTIMVVEGTEVARRSLLRLLEARGHVACAVAEAPEAASRLEARPVDLVLAAWAVPTEPVLDLLARLRAREAEGAPYTAFALLAAPSGRGEVPAALAAGADGLLPRPVDGAALDAQLPVLARLARLERALRASEDLVRRREETLREEARRDPLTGLGNRLRLDEDLRRLRGEAQRYGHRAGAVMLAVDQFRRFQDAEGRSAADALLRRVAEAIGDALRAGDTAYRFAGERLLVLLPEQGEDGAAVVAERCRARVAALCIPHPRSDASDVVTLSAGVAELHGSRREAVDAWLVRAEQALDAAHAAGGNTTAQGQHTRVAGITGVGAR